MLYDLFFLVFFFAALLGFIVLRIGMYEGWRHAYTVFCPFLYISIIGIDSVVAFVGTKQKTAKTAAVLAAVICLGSQLVWIAMNHPYQYAYFNILGRFVAEKNFSADYWYISQTELVREILEKDDKPILRVFGLNPPQLEILSEEEKTRIFLSDAAGAEYYFIGSRVAYNKRNPPSGYELINSTQAGGITISALYKRTEPAIEIDINAKARVAWVDSNIYGDLNALFDGDYETFWMTSEEQTGGEYIIIKFDSEVDYDYISLVLSEIYHNYYPRELALYTSIDGENWILRQATGNYLFKSEPEPYLYLKLENKQPHDKYGWTIFEIELGHSC